MSLTLIQTVNIHSLRSFPDTEFPCGTLDSSLKTAILVHTRTLVKLSPFRPTQQSLCTHEHLSNSHPSGPHSNPCAHTNTCQTLTLQAHTAILVHTRTLVKLSPFRPTQQSLCTHEHLSNSHPSGPHSNPCAHTNTCQTLTLQAHTATSTHV
ncbi:hypothetical protein V1264_022561 [Littorina saxatilis]|uniref:Uncharacterized protein n=1 Tax=Littorina saxatilis TaxID=31220 RepID=A0AAN9AKK0_9CAEN